MDALTFGQKKESRQRAVSWYKLVWIQLKVIFNLSYTLLGSVYLSGIFNLFYIPLGYCIPEVYF